jgi:hypothetical protein
LLEALNSLKVSLTHSLLLLPQNVRELAMLIEEKRLSLDFILSQILRELIPQLDKLALLLEALTIQPNLRLG